MSSSSEYTGGDSDSDLSVDEEVEQRADDPAPGDGCWWCLNACGSDEFQKGANSLMRHGMEYMGTEMMFLEMAKYRWGVFEHGVGDPPANYAREFQVHFEHLRSDEVMRYRVKCRLWDEMETARTHMYAEDENLGMVSGEPMKGAAGSFYNATGNLRQICRQSTTGGAFNT